MRFRAFLSRVHTHNLVYGNMREAMYLAVRPPTDAPIRTRGRIGKQARLSTHSAESVRFRAFFARFAARRWINSRIMEIALTNPDEPCLPIVDGGTEGKALVLYTAG